jgi:hypothetical protein
MSLANETAAGDCGKYTTSRTAPKNIVAPASHKTDDNTWRGFADEDFISDI